MAIYHVTRGWDGGDLLSLARQVDDGRLTLDEALEQIQERWDAGNVRAAERYLDGDGHEVHCCWTLAEAIEYRNDWCEDGAILEIDAEGLDVTEGQEYPHPVVRDVIPAERVKVLAPAEAE